MSLKVLQQIQYIKHYIRDIFGAVIAGYKSSPIENVERPVRNDLTIDSILDLDPIRHR